MNIEDIVHDLRLSWGAKLLDFAYDKQVSTTRTSWMHTAMVPYSLAMKGNIVCVS